MLINEKKGHTKIQNNSRWIISKSLEKDKRPDLFKNYNNYRKKLDKLITEKINKYSRSPKHKNEIVNNYEYVKSSPIQMIRVNRKVKTVAININTYPKTSASPKSNRSKEKTNNSLLADKNKLNIWPIKNSESKSLKSSLNKSVNLNNLNIRSYIDNFRYNNQLSNYSNKSANNKNNHSSITKFNFVYSKSPKKNLHINLFSNILEKDKQTKKTNQANKNNIKLCKIDLLNTSSKHPINNKSPKNTKINNSLEISSSYLKTEGSTNIKISRTQHTNKNNLTICEEKIKQEESSKILSKDYVMKYCTTNLYEQEIEELTSTNEIYFFGKRINDEIKNKSLKNKQTGNKNNRSPSNGNSKSIKNIDDEFGDFIIENGEHLNYRYELLDLLGKGSFGQAVKCFDHKIKKKVCVKIIKNHPKFSEQASIEVKILEHIKTKVNSDRNVNIVNMYEHFVFRNHLCIVFELLNVNLYEQLKLNQFRGMEMSLIRKISVEVLKCLNFLNKNKIIHCDLKPENILFKNWDTSVKLIDFGSSCFENEKIYTYIQSRFYRAPEIILGLEYSTKIDMWSYGCILVELYTGVPIFPGEDEYDQLAYMIEYLGLPPLHLIQNSTRASEFLDKNNKLLLQHDKKLKTPKSKSISKFLKIKDENFLDLIHKCLEWDANKRLSPIDALLHPWNTIGMSRATLQNYKLEETNLETYSKISNQKCNIENSRCKDKSNIDKKDNRNNSKSPSDNRTTTKVIKSLIFPNKDKDKFLYNKNKLVKDPKINCSFQKETNSDLIYYQLNHLFTSQSKTKPKVFFI